MTATLCCCCVFLPNGLEAGCNRRIVHDKDKGLRQSFLKRLGEGGLVIVLRHTSKEAVGEPVPVDSEDKCKHSDEPLHEKGKNQALEIKSAICELGVKFSQILHSQWCRTEQTAYLIDCPGYPEPKEEPNLNLGSGKDWLKNFIRSSISQGNVLLVTHSTNINNLGQEGLVVVESMDHGIAAIFDTKAPEHKSFMGCISPDEWAALTESERAPHNTDPVADR